MNNDLLSISIVSHNQGQIAKHILEDISAIGPILPAEILLTINISEHLPFKANDYNHPLKIIKNSSPRGFGANHNAAFHQSKGRYFCVLNPDIRLQENPFPILIDCLEKTSAGVVAPRIISPAGKIENSARQFPTPSRIAKKVVFRTETLDYANDPDPFPVDWVGGMFMVFPRESFDAVGGFDERYFLYYEDVDICARLQLANQKIITCPNTKAIHDARWDSHRNLKYLRWHLASMLRYFWSPGFRKLVVKPALRES